jgi:type IV secretory pathway VirB10-like protein
MAKGSRAAERVPVLILVTAAHVVVLLVLIALNRVPMFRGRHPEEPSILVWLPEVAEPVNPVPVSRSPPPAPPKTHPVQMPVIGPPPSRPTPEPENALTPEPERQAVPDWDSSAHEAASAEVARENAAQREDSRFTRRTARYLQRARGSRASGGNRKTKIALSSSQGVRPFTSTITAQWRSCCCFRSSVALSTRPRCAVTC